MNEMDTLILGGGLRETQQCRSLLIPNFRRTCSHSEERMEHSIKRVKVVVFGKHSIVLPC